PVGCSCTARDTWWTSADRAYGMRMVCRTSSRPWPSKTPVLHGGGVGLAWARARSATKMRMGNRYENRRRLTTPYSSGYSGPPIGRSQCGLVPTLLRSRVTSGNPGAVLLAGRAVDFPRGVRIHERDAESHDQVRPCGPEIGRDEAGGDDGDVGNRI